MKDSTFLTLIQAHRLVEKSAESLQDEMSRKWTKIPTGSFDKLMEAVKVALHEEIDCEPAK
jgi:hypothetical protein